MGEPRFNYIRRNRVNNYVEPELEELANQIGNFIQFWGFKHVQGRIWTHLYLSDSPLDAAELMKRLQISKALVSISVREMLEYEVILDAGKSERGTTLYRANTDQERVIMNVLRRRERVMLSQVSAAFRLCKKIEEKSRSGAKISERGMHQLGEMISNAELLLDAVLAVPNPCSSTWGLIASAAAHSRLSAEA